MTGSWKWQILELIYRFYVGIALSILSRIDFGSNIYEKEWDVLIVLDTCRVDTLRDVADEFEFLGDVQPIWSVGSTSSEWIAKTFTSPYEKEISNTTLISANPHTEITLFDRVFPKDEKNALFAWTSWDTVEPRHFGEILQPWKYAVDERYDRVLPERLTDIAVSTYREQDPERMIIHYMQPHCPHVAQAIQENRKLTPVERNPFEEVRRGNTDYDVIRGNHINDLQYVLETGIKPLLQNIDADQVVITADHGDGFGEWGSHGHPAGDLRPQIRRVPWVETTAENKDAIDISKPAETNERSKKEQLEALGYM